MLEGWAAFYFYFFPSCLSYLPFLTPHQVIQEYLSVAFLYVLSIDGCLPTTGKTLGRCNESYN